MKGSCRALLKKPKQSATTLIKSNIINNKNNIEKELNNELDIYYYKVVNKGFFKKKEVYAINMYTEKVYLINEDSIENY